MSNVSKQAERVQILMSEGMSLEEALTKVLGENQQVPKEERLAYIASLDNMELLGTLQHRAHAKKSKSKHNATAVARYDLEIKACQTRLGELRMKLTEEGDQISSLIKLGAKTSTIIQAWLTNKEKALEPLVAAYKVQNKLTNQGLKALVLKQPITLPESYQEELLTLGPDYLAGVRERLKKGDQRLVVLVRKANLIG